MVAPLKPAQLEAAASQEVPPQQQQRQLLSPLYNTERAKGRTSPPRIKTMLIRN